jgi:hypothetical protein
LRPTESTFRARRPAVTTLRARDAPPRHKKHRSERVLGVTIEGNSARWGCNHCDWKGPEKGNYKANGHASEFSTTYDYRDADGVLRFQKMRNPPGSKTRFFMRRPDSKGGWINDTKGVDTSLLYRIDEVNEQIALGREIGVVEGEKDADNLWAIGIPATCNAHGASEPGKKPKWTKQHSEQLRGADIVVMGDNDAPGRDHIEATASMSHGIAARVRTLDLAQHWPGIPEGGDISNWLDAGHTREQLDALIEAEAKPWAPHINGHAGVQSDAKANGAGPGVFEEPGDPGPTASEVNGATREPDRPQQTPSPAWPDLGKGGKPSASCANARAAIQALRIECRYDVFHDRKLVGGHAIEQWAGELSDDACQMLRVIIKETFGFDPGKENTSNAAVQLCLQQRFDPVFDYLASLQWDRTRRVDQWMTTYLGAEASDLNRAIGRLALVAAVRRARQPGCKFDQIIVLEGVEGTGKSTAIVDLAGKDNFSDQTIIGLDDRQQQEAMRGVWLYEIADLAGMSKADVDRTKAFASRVSDRARPAYGRHRIEQPRRCVFFATTNNTEYLKSQTGNRRFWPVKTSKIDIQGLRRDRDQLWAEAAQLARDVVGDRSRRTGQAPRARPVGRYPRQRRGRHHRRGRAHFDRRHLQPSPENATRQVHRYRR